MRILLPISIACALLCAGCASSLEKEERKKKVADSRAVEEARIRRLNYGDAGSERGAELMVPDESKAFDLGRATRGSSRTFQTGSAPTKDFDYAQKVQPQTYATRGFWGTKNSALSDKRFATREGATRGKYEIPNATTQAGTKTAAVKDAREAGQSLATRSLVDGDRPYLGPESRKVHKAIDPKTLGDWRTTGRTVDASGNSVEVYGDLKELSVDDVREILNKNK